LFGSAKIQATLSFLPGSSRIDSGDLTVACFLHVCSPLLNICVSPMLYSYGNYLLCAHTDPSFPFTCLYIADWSLGFFPFFLPCPDFPFWYPSSIPFLITWLPRLLCLLCRTWRSSVPMALKCPSFSPLILADLNVSLSFNLVSGSHYLILQCGRNVRSWSPHLFVVLYHAWESNSRRQRFICVASCRW
jgi:hypothetical protein